MKYFNKLGEKFFIVEKENNRYYIDFRVLRFEPASRENFNALYYLGSSRFSDKCLDNGLSRTEYVKLFYESELQELITHLDCENPMEIYEIIKRNHNPKCPNSIDLEYTKGLFENAKGVESKSLFHLNGEVKEPYKIKVKDLLDFLSKNFDPNDEIVFQHGHKNQHVDKNDTLLANYFPLNECTAFWIKTNNKFPCYSLKNERGYQDIGLTSSYDKLTKKWVSKISTTTDKRFANKYYTEDRLNKAIEDTKKYEEGFEVVKYYE